VWASGDTGGTLAQRNYRRTHILIECYHCVFTRGGGGLTRNGRGRPFINIIVGGGAIHRFELMTFGFYSIGRRPFFEERERENIYTCYMNTKSHTLFFH